MIYLFKPLVLLVKLILLPLRLLGLLSRGPLKRKVTKPPKKTTKAKKQKRHWVDEIEEFEALFYD